jgi:acetoin utilization deacetylase AcuC-like enzyme
MEGPQEVPAKMIESASSSVKVFSDLSTTAYSQPGHPEAPWRVSRSWDRLKSAGLEPQRPTTAAAEADVLIAHSAAHWRSVQTGGFQDEDTPFFPGIDQAALTSLSGALSALAEARRGRPAFSLMRPPGHHAARERVAGFCYVNNMAVACLKAAAEGVRVATVDVDVHHGDGTESIALGRTDWLFVSLHQTPLYPGTGLRSQDNCLNFPLPPFTAEGEYIKTLERTLERVLQFKPGLLAVSAGFDTYKDCPIAQMKLDRLSYRRMGKLLADTKLPRFAVLEGGYAEDLPILIENFISGFAG